MSNIFEPDLNMSLPLLNGTTIIQQPVNLNLLTEMYVQEAVGVINSSVAAKQPFFVCMSPLFLASINAMPMRLHVRYGIQSCART